MNLESLERSANVIDCRGITVSACDSLKAAAGIPVGPSGIEAAAITAATVIGALLIAAATAVFVSRIVEAAYPLVAATLQRLREFSRDTVAEISKVLDPTDR